MGILLHLALRSHTLPYIPVTSASTPFLTRCHTVLPQAPCPPGRQDTIILSEEAEAGCLSCSA